MQKKNMVGLCAGGVFAFVASGQVLANSAAVEQRAGASLQAADAPLPGPKYLNLRWSEDFSYLDGAEGTYVSDYFDPIKNIHLDDDWRLSLGGEFRFRLEAETNKAFGAGTPTQDTFEQFRFFLHADLQYKDVGRIFFQGVQVFDEGRDRALRGIDENQWDIQQLFFDLNILCTECPLTLRIGRQDVQLGNQRLISPLDWASTRRRLDAVSLFSHGDTWDVDLFYSKPVGVQRKQRDRFDEDYDLWGAYVTYKGIPDHGIDGYFFAQDRKFDRVNQNGKVGDEDRYTLGARFWGKQPCGCDYEAEVSGQWGHFAGDTIQAWSVSLVGGYTFQEFKCKPRIGIGLDWATGDDDPFDGKVGTFDQILPLGHAFFGYLDLVGRSNIKAFNLNISAWPVEKKVKTTAALHTFWLDEKEDALYGASGAAGRRDPFGDSGLEVGHELDLTVVWKIDRHSNLLLGYSHMWDSTFIQQTGVSEDPDLFYVQYGYKF